MRCCAAGCGWRRSPQLTLSALDLPRSQLFVYHGKGAKDRIVYLSHDAQQALVEYLKTRAFSRAKRLFLVGQGPLQGQSRIGACHPETHGALRSQGRAESKLPPATSHDGDSACLLQCGCDT